MPIDLHAALNGNPLFLASIFQQYAKDTGNQDFMTAARILLEADAKGQPLGETGIAFVTGALENLPSHAGGANKLPQTDTVAKPEESKPPTRTQEATEYNQMFDIVTEALSKNGGSIANLPPTMQGWVTESGVDPLTLGAVSPNAVTPPPVAVNMAAKNAGATAAAYTGVGATQTPAPVNPRFPIGGAGSGGRYGHNRPLTAGSFWERQQARINPKTEDTAGTDPLSGNIPAGAQDAYVEHLKTTGQLNEGFDVMELLQFKPGFQPWLTEKMSHDSFAGFKDGGVVRPRGAILHVGERDPNDGSGYATDEFVWADPGSDGEIIVAPRPKHVKPTRANALRLLKKAKRDALKKELVPAQEGFYQGSEFLLPMLLQSIITGGQMATEVPLAQGNLMSQLGYLVPSALGLTDPAEFRNALTTGGKIPTAQSTQFNQQLAQAMEQFSAQLGLDKTLGLGQLALGHKQAGNTAAYQQGQLALGQEEAAIRRMLGLGQLELGQGRLSLDELLGKGQLGLGKEQLSLDTLLGKGQLEFNYAELEEMTGLKREELDLLRRRVAGEEEERGFQRSIRGLKALPAVGNVASGMPTVGTAAVT